MQQYAAQVGLYWLVCIIALVGVHIPFVLLSSATTSLSSGDEDPSSRTKRRSSDPVVVVKTTSWPSFLPISPPTEQVVEDQRPVMIINSAAPSIRPSFSVFSRLLEDLFPCQNGETMSISPRTTNHLRRLQVGVHNNDHEKASKFNITLWVCLSMAAVLALAIYATVDIASKRDRPLYTKMQSLPDRGR